MTHDVSLTYSRFAHMPPAALALTTMLHVAVAMALYWVSPLRHVDRFEDVIEITMDAPVDAPVPTPPQATPEPAPTPAPAPAPTAVAPPPSAPQSQPQPPPAPAQRLGLAPPGSTTDPDAKPGVETPAPRPPEMPAPEPQQLEPQQQEAAKPEPAEQPVKQEEAAKAEPAEQPAQQQVAAAQLQAQPQPQPQPPPPPQRPLEAALPPLEAPPPPVTERDIPRPAPPALKPPPPRPQQARRPPPQQQQQQQALRPSPLSQAPQPRRAPADTQAARPSSPTFQNPADSYGQKRARDDYLWQVMRRIARFPYVPRNTNTIREEGTVLTRVTIGRDGRLIDVVMVKSSGLASLDAGVLETIRRASPYPRLPAAIPGNSHTFQLPVSFRYNEQR